MRVLSASFCEELKQPGGRLVFDGVFRRLKLTLPTTYTFILAFEIQTRKSDEIYSSFSVTVYSEDGTELQTHNYEMRTPSEDDFARIFGMGIEFRNLSLDKEGEYPVKFIGNKHDGDTDVIFETFFHVVPSEGENNGN